MSLGMDHALILIGTQLEARRVNDQRFLELREKD